MELSRRKNRDIPVIRRGKSIGQRILIILQGEPDTGRTILRASY